MTCLSRMRYSVCSAVRAESGPSIEYFVVPPLCPLAGSPYDFSRTADHIERAIDSTDAWLARNGLQKSGIPDEMRPHAH